MSSNKSIEERLAAVEQELSLLKRAVYGKEGSGNWLQGMVGAYKDDPAFDEATRWGSQVRRDQTLESHG
jgi:hypothetical protein